MTKIAAIRPHRLMHVLVRFQGGVAFRRHAVWRRRDLLRGDFQLTSPGLADNADHGKCCDGPNNAPGSNSIDHLTNSLETQTQTILRRNP